MKPKAANVIKLKFMDCSIELKDNKRNLEQRAYSLLAALVSDRLRMAEVMSELHEYDNDSSEKKVEWSRLPKDSLEGKVYPIEEKRTSEKIAEQRAYSLLAALVNDRFKMAEIMSELSHEEDETGRKSKKQRIKIDSEFLKMYA